MRLALWRELASLALALAALAGCDSGGAQASPAPAPSPAVTPTAAAPVVSSPPNPNGMPPGLPQLTAPVWNYKVVARLPHKTDAFTEGLLVSPQGTFFESTGQYGESSLREVEIKTGRVLRRVDLDKKYFGEGLSEVDGKLYQMTWQNHVGFIYQASDFKKLGDFKLDREGWGLTVTRQHQLIMSDGSNHLSYRNPKDFSQIKQVDVLEGGRPVVYINELEMFGDDVLANVWTTDYLAVIDPESGKVKAWIDLSGLLSGPERARADVLNGIAYDAKHKKLYVTGKYWPTVFEIEIQKS